jgi:tetratricopeptide (TPR) repeat protein
LALCLGLPSLPAILAGTLFALHPLHSEAVYLIVGRGELFAALFGLSFLISVLQRWHPLVLASLFGAALLSKESAVILPLLALLLWRMNHPDEPLKKLVYFVIHISLLSVPALLLLFLLRYHIFGILLSPEGYVHSLYNPLVSLPFDIRILNALWVQILYLKIMFLPLHLRADYSWNQIELIQSFWDLRTALTFGLIVIAGLLLAQKQIRRTPEVYGFLFILISMLPVSNIFFTAGTMFGERLTYLPLFGYCLFTASLFQLLWKWSIYRIWARASLLGLMFLLITLYSTAVVKRDEAWQNEDTFTIALVKDSPHSALAHGLRFKYLNEKGSKEAAAQHLLRALDIYPAYYDAWDSYGDFLRTNGDYEKAVSAYVRAANEVKKTRYDSAEASFFYYKAALLELAMGHCRIARDYTEKSAQLLTKPHPQKLKILKQQIENYACEQ